MLAWTPFDIVCVEVVCKFWRSMRGGGLSTCVRGATGTLVACVGGLVAWGTCETCDAASICDAACIGNLTLCAWDTCDIAWMGTFDVACVGDV